MSSVQWHVALFTTGLFAACAALALWLRAREKSHPIPEDVQRELDAEPGWWTSAKGHHDA
jgi:hypothetical protein